MLRVKKEGVVLRKTSLDFENEGVLNPAIFQDGNKVHMFYRAVSKGNFSSIGYCRLNGPLNLTYRKDSPFLFPDKDYEIKGIEDPRIVKLDNQYFLTYTAYDGINALGALAVSNDLVHFRKLGLIVPQMDYEEFCKLAEAKGEINLKYLRYNEHRHETEDGNRKMFLWDKNVIFFPRRIQGKMVFLHRVRPDIQIVAVNELTDLTPVFWRHYFLNLDESIVLSSKYKHEISYIGGGCPPIETPEGWVLIYHAVHDTIKGYVYTACAALLELEHPCREIARLPIPLFYPEEDWELLGYVNNVCFPTGTSLFGDILYIYYGAADEQIACASMSLTELVAELLMYKIIRDDTSNPCPKI